MNSPKNDSGSMLMEFVLIAPILYFLIFGVIQFAYIFLARQMTFYAAYSAARAALVYNVKDYSNFTGTYSAGAGENSGNDPAPAFELFQNRGPLFVAACTVLSWLNSGSSESMEFFPGPDSDVWNRVLISGKEFHGTSDGASGGVSVTVHYFCPLFVPLIGDFLAAALGRSDQDGEPADDWSVVGWLPRKLPDYAGNISVSPALRVARSGGILSIHLQETCYLAKPYDTRTYARIPAEDQNFFRLARQNDEDEQL